MRVIIKGSCLGHELCPMLKKIKPRFVNAHLINRIRVKYDDGEVVDFPPSDDLDLEDEESLMPYEINGYKIMTICIDVDVETLEQIVNYKIEQLFEGKLL